MKRSHLCLILSALGLVMALAIAAVVIAAITLTKVNSDTGAREPPPSDIPTTNSTTTRSPTIDLVWWKTTPIYQIYPRSFKDSDSDGTGDLRGIKSKIPYVRDLGVKAVWLSPVYESPMKDFGYDISNFTNIDPLFGSMQDFDELVDEIHKNDMYLIMDFVPNHSSDQHPWFQQSLAGTPPYDEYYVWRKQANNWLSNFGNSSWQWADERQSNYLHQFLIEQPDLNYRSPDLRQEMIDILRFWIERGVDGFRMDAIVYLIEDERFLDEPKSGLDVPENDYNYLDPIYTKDQQGTYDVVANWTAFLKSYGDANNKTIFTMTEGYTDIPHVMKYYSIGVDIPFNFNLINLDSTTKASDLRKMITDWMNNMPAGSWPNWVLGNHDRNRIATRLGGRQYTDMANMLLLTLPGTPTYYNGDEIGMINANISYEDSRDPAGCKWGPEAYLNYTRDPERTPMQWSTAAFGGFTDGNSTWLPMGPDYETYNVEVESKDPDSHLNIFKSLVRLRGEPAFRMATNLRLIELDNESIFAYTREFDAESSYLIVLNFGHDGKEVSIGSGLATGVGKVVVRSGGAKLKVGDTVNFDEPLVMEDGDGYVIQLG